MTTDKHIQHEADSKALNVDSCGESVEKQIDVQRKMKWSGRTGRMRRTSERAEPCWTWNRAQSIGNSPAPLQPLAFSASSLRTGSFLDFWKCVALTTMTCSSSPPRPRPPLLKIGALRPQWPQMYPPNFQRLKLVPSTTRSRHPLPALYRVPRELTEPSCRQ